MTYIEGQRQFAIDTRKEKLVFPIELRRESSYKVVSEKDKQLLDQLNLEMKNLYVNGLEKGKQSDLFQHVSDEFQQLCESLSWEKNKLPVKTLVHFRGIAYGYYCITHPGKFVVARMKDPNNPEQETTLVLSKSAFKKPTEQSQPKPRKLTRKAALGRADEYQTISTVKTVEKIPMTRITIYPGVRLFTFEGDPKTRLEGQTDEQREETLNNLRPLIVKKKVKMIVPGEDPKDSYAHTEGTFFKGVIIPPIGDKDQIYWATIGDVRSFAKIGRERDKQLPRRAA